MLKINNNNIIFFFLTISLYLYEISFKRIIPFLSFSYLHRAAVIHLNNMTTYARFCGENKKKEMNTNIRLHQNVFTCKVYVFDNGLCGFIHLFDIECLARFRHVLYVRKVKKFFEFPRNLPNHFSCGPSHPTYTLNSFSFLSISSFQRLLTCPHILLFQIFLSQLWIPLYSHSVDICYLRFYLIPFLIQCQTPEQTNPYTVDVLATFFFF